jgi:hypothetical protein
MLELLAKQYLPALEALDALKMTPLHYFAANANITFKALTFFIGENPKALMVQNTSGFTPFHFLASNKTMTVDFFESSVLPDYPEIVKGMMDPAALRRTINSEVSKDVQAFLFGCRPIMQAEFSHVAEAYLKSLHDFPPTSLLAFPSWRQDGWVEFASSDFSDCKEDLLTCCKELISTCSDACASVLAYAKDFMGRTALDVAIPELKAALRARLPLEKNI